MCGRCRRGARLRPNDSPGRSGQRSGVSGATTQAMLALAEIDLGTLTPAQRDAAVQAIAALERLRAENETLAEEKACLAGENEVLTDRNGAQAERIRRLEHLVRELQRVVHGKRSEKLTPDERQLAFEDLEGASAEAEAAPPAPSPASSPKRPRAARNIGHLPEHLKRIEQVIEPESTLCPCGCGEMVKIGEDRTERLDIVPAQLRVIVTVRPKYACRACEQGVVQAPAPARLIEGALPTEGAIAPCAHLQIPGPLSVVSPIDDLRAFGARSGPLDAGRLGRQGLVPSEAGGRPVGPAPEDILEAVHGRDAGAGARSGPRAGRRPAGWWALARDDRPWSGPDPPGVVYFYAPGRGGEHAEKFLDGFRRHPPGRRLCRLQSADRPGPQRRRTAAARVLLGA